MSPSATSFLHRVRNLTLTRRQYFVIAAVALGSLAVIVMTGSAVRLTGSGLGCPDWPRCYEDRVVPEADLNAVIEFANRLFTGFVGVAVIAASVLAFRRRPFRWHLALFGALLPIGVVCQAILGAIVVEYDLKPELVMGHFILSMLLLDAAFALAWCSRYEPGERPASTDRLGVWAVRGLFPLGQLTIIAGTIATGSGPHPGDHEDELVQRFDFEGGFTLQWVVERHSVLAAALGLAAIGVWFLLRRRGGERRALRPLTALIGLLALQGVVGGIQWAAELPAAIVWVHVVLATLTWLAVLWTVAAAGRVAPRGAVAPRAIAGPAPAVRAPEGAATT